MFDKREDCNIQAIRRLNQRGGRMLSIVDLLADDTLNLEMAGILFFMMLNKFSFLTAANPSGTGKTTLMGALLNLLKPGMKIKTIEKQEDLYKVEEKEENCYLIHEIGSGPYYSYLWGSEIDRFMDLGEHATIASCIHADTLPELEKILMNSPLSVEYENFMNLDLILFMVKENGLLNPRRRVRTVYGSNGEKFILLYQWDKKNDEFMEKQLDDYLNYLSDKMNIAKSDIQKKIKKSQKVIAELQEKNIKEIEEIREIIVNKWEEGIWK